MTDLRRCFTMVCLVGLTASVAGAAAAGESGEVWVELPACSEPPVDADQLSSALALELSPYGLRANVRTSAPPGGTQIRVLLASCDAGADSLLLHWEVPGEPPRRRELSLRDVPSPARARTLALWISDALRPSRLQESDDPAHSAPNAEQPPAAFSLAPVPDDPLYDSELLQRSDPYPHPYPVYWSGGVRANWVPRVGVLLYGMGMGVSGRVFGPTEWSVDASYTGGRSKALDDVFDFAWLNAALGLDYNFTEARRIQLGPRLSVSRMIGYSETGESAEMAETLALLGARLRISPHLHHDHVSLELLLDASYPLMTLHEAPPVSAVPWTAWVITMGAGLTIEL
jgi:hypothetical protein